MFKKIAFWVLVICLLIAALVMAGTGLVMTGVGLVMSGKAIIKTDAEAVSPEKYGLAKDYRIEVRVPGRRILVELVRDEPVTGVRAEELGRYRSSVEIFNEAMDEVEEIYNCKIYSACPILEPGYPPLLGSWTKALILFVEQK